RDGRLRGAGSARGRDCRPDAGPADGRCPRAGAGLPGVRIPIVKARLDHIGIAVANLDEALAFYRDALGLDVSVPHDVPTERVRATFVPVGGPALELLEPTAPDSVIARYI